MFQDLLANLIVFFFFGELKNLYPFARKSWKCTMVLQWHYMVACRPFLVAPPLNFKGADF